MPALLQAHPVALSGAQVHRGLCALRGAARHLLHAGRDNSADAHAGAVVSSGSCVKALHARRLRTPAAECVRS